MDYFELKSIFDELLERLDQYFDNKLTKEPRAKANLEMYKDELLQELQIQLWRNHSKPAYNTYLPQTFIWLKAEQAWIKFTRNLDKQSKQNSEVELINLPDNLYANNFCDEFENKDLITAIEGTLSAEEFELVQYRMRGFTYKEIIQLTNYSSVDAAKTKFNRIKYFIRTRFNRF